MILTNLLGEAKSAFTNHSILFKFFTKSLNRLETWENIFIVGLEGEKKKLQTVL